MLKFLLRKIDNIILFVIGIFILVFINSCNRDGLPNNVTFNEHIAPILYNNCCQCHRNGGTSHFSLVSYKSAKMYAGSIAYVVKERLMPPWPADPNYTQFVGQRVLNEQEIKIILKWVAEGTPEGKVEKLPDMPVYPEGSLVGKPDLRILVTPYLLKKNSEDKFLLVKVPFEFYSDTFASLIEFVPGKKNLVHHVNGDLIKYKYNEKQDIFAGEKIVNMEEDTVHLLQAFEKLGLPNDNGSYPLLQKSVVNYLPGAFGQIYPEGIGGYFLPRKSVFLLNDLHYGFNGNIDVWDSSYINIFYSKTPPKRPVQEFQLGTLGVAPAEPDLIIEPNTVKQVHSKFTVPCDISILTVNPHMHQIGKSFIAYATAPNGDTIRLISIPKWDFNWQYFYTYKKPVKIPKGSTIIAEGVYDNTSQNLNNPFNPPRLIRDQNGSMKSTDEMFQFIITYLPYQIGDENINLERK